MRKPREQREPGPQPEPAGGGRSRSAQAPPDGRRRPAVPGASCLRAGSRRRPRWKGTRRRHSTPTRPPRCPRGDLSLREAPGGRARPLGLPPDRPCARRLAFIVTRCPAAALLCVALYLVRKSPSRKTRPAGSAQLRLAQRTAPPGSRPAGNGGEGGPSCPAPRCPQSRAAPSWAGRSIGTAHLSLAGDPFRHFWKATRRNRKIVYSVHAL